MKRFSLFISYKLSLKESPKEESRGS